VNRVRNGFTLIELLVVIAIIAILAAILFPVFAQARESARQTSCLSNTKQLGLGILQYVQDYDEKFPLWLYDDNSPARDKPDQPWGPWKNQHVGWDKAIQPYVKNTQIFRCPSNDTGDPSEREVADDDSRATGAVNYSMNARLNSKAQTTALAGMRFPAVTILLAESSRGSSTGESSCDTDNEWGWNGGHAHQLNGDNNFGASGNVDTNYTNINSLCKGGPNATHSQWGQSDRLRAHKGGANYAFGDGHSKWAQGDASCVVWDRGLQGGIPRNESGSTMTYIP
jgi:prepilin-type N-terminal cleavage/methylation domain-containing protein/prepilin-type processing-associated H-X9-DG protein